MAMVTARVASENTSAIRLTSRSRARRSAGLPGADLPGVSAIATAPTSGIAPATVSQGKVLIRSAASSALEPHQQERADQQHGPDAAWTARTSGRNPDCSRRSRPDDPPKVAATVLTMPSTPRLSKNTDSLVSH